MGDAKLETKLVTLPISDTIPGPGSYTVRMLHMDDVDDTLPVVDATDLIDHFGAGTARDTDTTAQVLGVD